MIHSIVSMEAVKVIEEGPGEIFGSLTEVRRLRTQILIVVHTQQGSRFLTSELVDTILPHYFLIIKYIYLFSITQHYCA